MRIVIINGPNLNLLGTREPQVYGNKTFDDCYIDLQQRFADINFSYFQSNIEGEIINKIQACITDADALIINPAGYTHTSVGISDALAILDIPKVEVHISNIYKREQFRHISLTAANVDVVISGAGLNSYLLAVQYILLQKNSAQ